MGVETGTPPEQEAMVCLTYGHMDVQAVVQSFAVIICCVTHVLRGEDFVVRDM